MFTEAATETLVAAKKRVNVFLDFDGTLTKSEGRDTVNAPLYAQMIHVPHDGRRPSYDIAIFLQDEDNNTDYSRLHNILKKGFENKSNDAMQMLNGAKQFIINLLNETNFACKIYIITRNRKDYIIPNLMQAGFEPKQIDAIEIFDINDIKHGGKGAILKKISADQPACISIVADDNPADARDMRNNISHGRVLCYSEQPGNFNFSEIEANLQSTISEIIAACQNNSYTPRV